MDYEDFIEFIEVIENADEQDAARMPKRYIRDMENPFEYYRLSEFKKRYRFSKLTVQNIILPMVQNVLEKEDNRGLPILPIYQLFLTLRFYATGDFQIVDGDLRGLSQATVSRTIKRVSEAIARRLRHYVKFSEDPLILQDNIRKFYNMGHFPAISSCVDGAHIPIKNPGGNIGEVFRNRKGIFSLNVQVACGPSMEILDIVARFPGSMHDNVIFQRSSLRIKYENNEIPGKILGDNGYACQRYLLTPVLNPLTRAEINYNMAHKRTRNIIERCFGIWKRRFPCLRRGLLTKIGTATAIICAVAVLHNIAKSGQDDIDEEEMANEERGFVNNVVDNPNAGGLDYRRAFIIAHFQD